MTAMAISTDKRFVRRGETLIEIMASIMVLSIGLVGVLAAIPFGGFRMSQMTEADSSAAVGRNAVRMIRINGWGNPESWWIRQVSPSSIYKVGTYINEDSDGEYINTTVPFVLDPLGDGPTSPFVTYPLSASPSSYNLPFVHVSPLPTDRLGGKVSYNVHTPQDLGYWYSYLFYQQDDLVSYYYSNEDESEFRPRIDSEEKYLLEGSDRPEIPSFSGRYSWMVFVYPKSSFVNPFRSPLTSIVSADYDAVVFRDRILDDERVFEATVTDAGYQGGTIVLNLATCRDVRDVVSDAADRAKIREQLSQTRYIMLAGPDDNKSGVLGTFARWYKIANFANVGDNQIRLTLIGANTPSGWANGGVVTAIFYPGVIGVYSGSTTF